MQQKNEGKGGGGDAEVFKISDTDKNTDIFSDIYSHTTIPI